MRPPLNRRTIIKPDIVLAVDKSTHNSQCPEICFAMGDYKKKNYYLTRGLEGLELDILDYKENLSSQETLRLLSKPILYLMTENGPLG